MAENEVEIEQGPAVAGPAEVLQPVDRPVNVLTRSSVPPAAQADKVFNVGADEIALQAKEKAIADEDAKATKDAKKK